MSTQAELKQSLQAILQQTGDIDTAKALLRTSLYTALAQQQQNNAPQLSNTNLILNTLILEYLQYNGYVHTHSTLQVESNMQNNGTLPHELLAAQLNIRDSNSHVPLLYSILALLQQDSETARVQRSNE